MSGQRSKELDGILAQKAVEETKLFGAARNPSYVMRRPEVGVLNGIERLPKELTQRKKLRKMPFRGCRLRDTEDPSHEEFIHSKTLTLFAGFMSNPGFRAFVRGE
jgi:hypothetical protein